jgi:hypothetical protein
VDLSGKATPCLISLGPASLTPACTSSATSSATSRAPLRQPITYVGSFGVATIEVPLERTNSTRRFKHGASTLGAPRHDSPLRSRHAALVYPV